MVIIGLGLAWLGGILTGHWVRLPLVFVAGALVPLAVFLILRRHGRLLITLALGIVAFVAADAHASASLYEFDEQDLRYYNDRGTFEIEGMVAGDADIRDRNTRLTVEVSAIRLDDGWHDVGGKLLVLVPRYPDRHYGDVLRLSGELRTPPHLDDFDYRGYLEHHGIYSIMYYPRVEVLGTGDGLAFLRWVYAVRERLSRVLARVLPEPQASLAQGILLGIRSNIPGWLNEAFSRSGTFHLLAISGLNISIMAGIMLGAGILLFGRRHYVYVWLALAAIWVYALLTGMSPPVVRSAIMAGLFLLAEALGRQRSAVVVILLAGAIMAGISPYILGDVSFQLSFLAMLGLIFIYPVLRSFRERLVPEGGGIWHLLSGAVIDTIGASLAAIIAVLPLIVRYFGIFSPVAPLATLLTVPVLPLTISVGVVTACGGAIWLPLGQALGWGLWLFLTYMVAVIRLAAAPSFASLEIPSVSLFWVFGYYAVLIVAVAVYYRWRHRRLVSFHSARTGMDLSRAGMLSGARWLVLPLLLLAALIAGTAVTFPEDDLTVSFLDVGQGDAVLIRRGSRQVLVDGGPSPREISLRLGEHMPFWDRSIDLVVLTHPHEDHLAGLVEVLRRYQVGRVLYPPSGANSSLSREWLRLVDERDIEVLPAAAGQRISLGGGVFLDVLYVPEVSAAREEKSIVLSLECGAVSFLLTGDIAAPEEWELLRRRALDGCTVLKVPHHGSKTASSPEFLSMVRPKLAVISVGAANRYGLPDGDVIGRLEGLVGRDNIYRTDEHGSVTFVTDGSYLRVKTQK